MESWKMTRLPADLEKSLSLYVDVVLEWEINKVTRKVPSRSNAPAKLVVALVAPLNVARAQLPQRHSIVSFLIIRLSNAAKSC